MHRLQFYWLISVTDDFFFTDANFTAFFSLRSKNTNRTQKHHNVISDHFLLLVKNEGITLKKSNEKCFCFQHVGLHCSWHHVVLNVEPQINRCSVTQPVSTKSDYSAFLLL